MKKLNINSVTVWRWYAGVLLTGITILGSVLLKVAFQINDKVEYSYTFNAKQEIINEDQKDKDEEQDEAIMVNDSRMDKISERFYSLEAILKYQNYQPVSLKQN